MEDGITVEEMIAIENDVTVEEMIAMKNDLTMEQVSSVGIIISPWSQDGFHCLG